MFGVPGRSSATVRVAASLHRSSLGRGRIPDRTAVRVRYAEAVATSLDRDKLHDVLDQAVVVIDEQDLERSRRDPRVRAFHDGADKLLAELEAEGADYC
jgi:hypothetical protein